MLGSLSMPIWLWAWIAGVFMDPDTLSSKRHAGQSGLRVERRPGRFWLHLVLTHSLRHYSWKTWSHHVMTILESYSKSSQHMLQLLARLMLPWDGTAPLVVEFARKSGDLPSSSGIIFFDGVLVVVNGFIGMPLWAEFTRADCFELDTFRQGYWSKDYYRSKDFILVFDLAVLLNERWWCCSLWKPILPSL